MNTITQTLTTVWSVIEAMQTLILVVSLLLNVYFAYLIWQQEKAWNALATEDSTQGDPVKDATYSPKEFRSWRK